MYEIWWFEGLTSDAHTAEDRFVNTRIKPNWNITYLLVKRRVVACYTGVGESVAGVGCDPTHYTDTRSDILSASTCSALSPQEGRALL
jgi:hypothetical protein